MLVQLRRCMAFLGLVATAFGCPTPLLAAVQYDAATIRLVGTRLARAEAARRTARDPSVPSSHRVAALVEVLEQELANPVPDNSASLPFYTWAEQIQCQILSALRETGDFTSIAAAWVAAPYRSPIGKRLTIATADVIGSGADRAVVKRVCQLLSDLILNDADDFIRSKAAAAMANAGRLHPDLRAEAAGVLAEALRDPAFRMVQHHSGIREPQRINFVYLAARHSLIHLGYEVNGFRVSEKGAAATPVAAGELAGKDAGPVAAREVLADNGYQVTWDAEKKELKAVRGARLVLLRAGSDKAVVDGRQQKMDAPARLVDSRLQIPGSFMAPARK